MNVNNQVIRLWEGAGPKIDVSSTSYQNDLNTWDPLFQIYDETGGSNYSMDFYSTGDAGTGTPGIPYVDYVVIKDGYGNVSSYAVTHNVNDRTLSFDGKQLDYYVNNSDQIIAVNVAAVSEMNTSFTETVKDNDTDGVLDMTLDGSWLSGVAGNYTATQDDVDRSGGVLSSGTEYNTVTFDNSFETQNDNGDPFDVAEQITLLFINGTPSIYLWDTSKTTIESDAATYGYYGAVEYGSITIDGDQYSFNAVSFETMLPLDGSYAGLGAAIPYSGIGVSNPTEPGFETADTVFAIHTSDILYISSDGENIGSKFDITAGGWVHGTSDDPLLFGSASEATDPVVHITTTNGGNFIVPASAFTQSSEQPEGTTAWNQTYDDMTGLKSFDWESGEPERFDFQSAVNMSRGDWTSASSSSSTSGYYSGWYDPGTGGAAYQVGNGDGDINLIDKGDLLIFDVTAFTDGFQLIADAGELNVYPNSDPDPAELPAYDLSGSYAIDGSFDGIAIGIPGPAGAIYEGYQNQGDMVFVTENGVTDMPSMAGSYWGPTGLLQLDLGSDELGSANATDILVFAQYDGPIHFDYNSSAQTAAIWGAVEQFTTTTSSTGGNTYTYYTDTGHKTGKIVEALGSNDNAAVDVFVATDFADLLEANAEHSISFIAGDGDDSVYGGNQVDFIDGGEGFDYVNGGGGNDIIVDFDDGAVIEGGAGKDIFMVGDRLSQDPYFMEGSGSSAGFITSDSHYTGAYTGSYTGNGTDNFSYSFSSGSFSSGSNSSSSYSSGSLSNSAHIYQITDYQLAEGPSLSRSQSGLNDQIVFAVSGAALVDVISDYVFQNDGQIDDDSDFSKYRALTDKLTTRVTHQEATVDGSDGTTALVELLYGGSTLASTQVAFKDAATGQDNVVLTPEEEIKAYFVKTTDFGSLLDQDVQTKLFGEDLNDTWNKSDLDAAFASEHAYEATDLWIQIAVGLETKDFYTLSPVEGSSANALMFISDTGRGTTFIPLANDESLVGSRLADTVRYISDTGHDLILDRGSWSLDADQRDVIDLSDIGISIKDIISGSITINRAELFDEGERSMVIENAQETTSSSFLYYDGSGNTTTASSSTGGAAYDPVYKDTAFTLNAQEQVVENTDSSSAFEVNVSVYRQYSETNYMYRQEDLILVDTDGNDKTFDLGKAYFDGTDHILETEGGRDALLIGGNGQNDTFVVDLDSAADYFDVYIQDFEAGDKLHLTDVDGDSMFDVDWDNKVLDGDDIYVSASFKSGAADREIDFIFLGGMTSGTTELDLFSVV